MTNPIDQFRQEIDAIDDQLIDLLKQRIQVVQKVGEYKRDQGESGAFIRPGREGKMHRRIYDAFRDTAFHPQAALQIWRMLISASTHHESPLSLSVMQQNHDSQLVNLAQEYFGHFLQVQTNTNPVHIVADVYDRNASIGILPYPQDETNWWHALAQYQEPRVYIFAQLPLVNGARDAIDALAVAEVMPESSALGDEIADESYFVITLEDTVSTSKLQSVFQDAGLEPTFLNTATQAPMRSVLVRLDGFYTDKDAAIDSIGKTLDAAIRWLGAHPKAIAV